MPTRAALTLIAITLFLAVDRADNRPQCRCPLYCLRSPAISDGQIFIRMAQHLHYMGKRHAAGEAR